MKHWSDYGVGPFPTGRIPITDCSRDDAMDQRTFTEGGQSMKMGLEM